jgi:soluble lytic murein transglycosylase-like protein
MGLIRLPRVLRLASWLVGSLSLVAPMAQKALERGAEVAAPVVAAPLAAVASEETEVMMQVARWLQPTTAKLSEAVSKDPTGFQLFAAFHGQAERRAVLATEEVPFAKEIVHAATEHAVDPLLVAAVVEVESTFDPKAGSHKGAVGLMQLLPSTAGMSRQKLLEPRTNLDAGAEYLAELIERFDGDLTLALAAYNAGPRHVRNYEGIPPFPETQQYVEKVLGIYVDYNRELWQQSGAEKALGTLS